MGILDLLDNEKDVQADAAPVNGEIIDKSNIVGVVARFLATYKVGENNSSKHIFRLPSGQKGEPAVTFALWGDAALNALLKKIKAEEIVGMIYDGKQPGGGGYDVHRWRVKLVTSTGEALSGLIYAAEESHVGVRQAIDHAKREREARRTSQGQEQPPRHTDADAPSW